MTDDTPLERAVENAKLKAAMARNPNPPTRTNDKPSLQEEYDAMVKAGLIEPLPAVPAPARESTVDAEIAAHVAAVVSQILSVP